MIKTLTSDYFETLKKCHKAFYFKYVKGINFSTKKDVYKLGRDIHSMIYYKLQGMPLEKIEKNLDEQTLKHWENLKNDTIIQNELICAEWGFDVPLDEEHWINGRIDAVFKSGDEYIIADWKTGQNLPYAPSESYQSMIYMWAFYQCQEDLGLNFAPEQLKFVFVSTENQGVHKEVQCSSEMIEKIDMLLKDKIKEAETIETYDKNEKSCIFCPYESICS